MLDADIQKWRIAVFFYCLFIRKMFHKSAVIDVKVCIADIGKQVFRLHAILSNPDLAAVFWRVSTRVL